ncbi:MAG: ribosome-associated translation inhibitor RaiA [Armatimonadetes bacterium]|nr:ribosome-associated translation inhibitor RaiA [Armatimonadota bacterium]
MLIQIKGKNLEVTDALRNYVNKKLRKLEKYFHSIKEATVTMSVSRGMHVVEVQLEGDGILLRGEERRGTDMYGSIDQVVEKLETQVKKFKGKLYGKTTEEGPKEKESIKDQVLAEAFGPETEREEMPTIVRTKRFTMKPMTPEEAAQQMELLNHNFFVFLNSQTDDVNVVYKRQDGNYGLIEPA